MALNKIFPTEIFLLEKTVAPGSVSRSKVQTKIEAARGRTLLRSNLTRSINQTKVSVITTQLLVGK
jgi:hypothetical protein